MNRRKPAAAAKIFAAAEKPRFMADGEFIAAKDDLRLDLVRLQQRIRADAKFPVIVVLAGVQGAGVIDMLNVINTWMDPRWVETQAFEEPSQDERERPPSWRYWRSLPAKGTIGLYLEGWYGELLGLTAARTPAQDDERLRRIASFERMLEADGALIIKFWLHIAKGEQRRKRGEPGGADPIFGLRPADLAWRPQPPYTAYCRSAARLIAATDTDRAPWHVIAGNDANHRRFTVLDLLRRSFETHVARTARASKKSLRSRAPAKLSGRDVLAEVDLSSAISDRDYASAFHRQQLRLFAAQQAARSAKIPSVFVFEGWDAAGKGGAIRRLAYGLSAYNYKVVPVAAPSEEENAQHYLWRFWRTLGRAGRMTIFDRSWYGRVLVERVDGLAPEAAWRRAYDEINAFEEELISSGTVLLKFWMHISRQEQLARFKARAKDPARRWKLTDADWHNRKKWNAYLAAVNDMIKRTSTTRAPWTVVPANDKNFARIAVLDSVAGALERALAGGETR